MDAHDHEAIVHDHRHVHVTHYVRHGSDPEHELATHATRTTTPRSATSTSRMPTRPRSTSARRTSTTTAMPFTPPRCHSDLQIVPLLLVAVPQRDHGLPQPSFTVAYQTRLAASIRVSLMREKRRYNSRLPMTSRRSSTLRSADAAWR